MSFKSVILLNGFAAKLPLTNAFSELNYTTSGILREFKFKNTKFRYFGHFYFPGKKQQFKSGYHDVIKVNNYFDNNGVKISDLKPFDFTPYLSEENETVSTKFIDYGEPYTAYHKMKLATFQVQLEGTPPTKRKEYIDPENFQEILFPSGTTYTDVNTSFPDSNPRKHFYKINFGDRVSAWTNCDKRKLCRVYTQIALTQSSIVSVFDTFPAITKIDNVGKGIAGSYNDLLLSEKIIYDLKLSWGYYFEFGKAATALFDNAPNETEADAYLNSLKNFLYNITINKNAIINMSELSKVVNLFYILPSSAMSIISIPNRVKAIDFILKHTFVNQTDEYSILKIIYSVQSSDANEFLDALVSESNNDLLMRIYDKMDDVRLGRYFFINLFVFEKTNKRYFCEAIYNLWKYSNYSPYLADSNGDFSETVNLNCMFITEAISPNKSYGTTLEFNGDKIIDGTAGLLVYQNKKFDTSVKYKRVQLYEVTDNTYKLSLPAAYALGMPILSLVSYTDEVSRFAKTSYHYFEPIHLIGFTPDEELILPKAPAIPAFLFHYAKDFDKIKTFDNRLNLAVELAADFAVNYFTGGLTAFKYLGHMKYTNSAIRGYFNTGQWTMESSVLLWRGLDISTYVVSVSAQNLTIFFNYLKKEDPDSEFAKAAFYFFFWVSIVSGGLSFVASRKAIGSANKFLDEIEILPPQKYAQIPTEVKDAVAIIKGEITLLRSEFDGFLNQAENTVVKNKYLALPNLETRDAFMLDFIGSTKTNKELWKSFNADATMVDRWKDLYDLKLAERLELEVLTNNELVLGIKKFYPDAGVKLVLQKTTDSARKAFLTKFSSTSSTVENAFKSNNDLVAYWAKYQNDLATQKVFLELSDANQLLFLNRYGDIGEDVFRVFRNHPKLISDSIPYLSNPNLSTKIASLTQEEQLLFIAKYPPSNLTYFNKFTADPTIVPIYRNYLKQYVPLKQANYPRLTNATDVFNQYQLHGKKLYEKVMQDVETYVNSGVSKKIMDRFMLKSGFSHQDFPDTIFLRDNIDVNLLDEFLEAPKDKFGNALNEVWLKTADPTKSGNMFDIEKIKAIYFNFETGAAKQIHPWLEKRIVAHMELRVNNKWLVDEESIGRTGHIPGIHAEVRALNALLWDLQSKNITISDDLLTKILGCNVKYNKKELMPRCADCFFITKGINIIKVN